MRLKIFAATVLAVVAATVVAPVAAQQTTRQPDVPGAGAKALAGALNVFYVPGKVITCAASIGLGGTAMAITFGALWEETAHVIRGGCGGRWAVSARQVHRATRDRGGDDDR